MHFFLTIIENFLSGGREVDPRDPEYQKLHFINGIGFVAIVLLSCFTIANFLLNDLTYIFEGCLVGLLIVAVVVARMTGKTDFAAFSGLFVAVSMAIDNFLFGGYHQTGILWLFVTPPIVYFLTGSKQGTRWMFGIFSLLGVFTVLHVKKVVALPYPDFTLFMLFVSLAVTTLFIFIYQKNRESTEISLTTVLEELRVLNKIITLTNSISDPEQLLKEALATSVSSVNFDEGAVVLRFDKTKKVSFISSNGVFNRFIAKVLSSSQFLQQFSKPTSLYLENLEKSLWNIAIPLGIRKLAVLPISKNGEIVGYFILYNSRSATFSPRNKSILDSVIQEIGSALVRIDSENSLKRTLADLETKNKELGTLNNLMLGRELKLADMKKKIRSLSHGR